MSKAIKNIKVKWTWQGDELALKGFNLALCEKDKLPIEESIQQVFTTFVAKSSFRDGHYQYIIKNVPLNLGGEYKIYAQAVYQSGNSDWALVGQILKVTADPSETIETEEGSKEKSGIVNSRLIDVIQGRVPSGLEDLTETFISGKEIKSPRITALEIVGDDGYLDGSLTIGKDGKLFLDGTSEVFNINNNVYMGKFDDLGKYGFWAEDDLGNTIFSIIDGSAKFSGEIKGAKITSADGITIDDGTNQIDINTIDGIKSNRYELRMDGSFIFGDLSKQGNYIEWDNGLKVNLTEIDDLDNKVIQLSDEYTVKIQETQDGKAVAVGFGMAKDLDGNWEFGVIADKFRILDVERDGDGNIVLDENGKATITNNQEIFALDTQTQKLYLLADLIADGTISGKKIVSGVEIESPVIKGENGIFSGDISLGNDNIILCGDSASPKILIKDNNNQEVVRLGKLDLTNDYGLDIKKGQIQLGAKGDGSYKFTLSNSGNVTTEGDFVSKNDVQAGTVGYRETKLTPGGLEVKRGSSAFNPFYRIQSGVGTHGVKVNFSPIFGSAPKVVVFPANTTTYDPSKPTSPQYLVLSANSIAEDGFTPYCTLCAKDGTTTSVTAKTGNNFQLWADAFNGLGVDIGVTDGHMPPNGAILQLNNSYFNDFSPIVTGYMAVPSYNSAEVEIGYNTNVWTIDYNPRVYWENAPVIPLEIKAYISSCNAYNGVKIYCDLVYANSSYSTDYTVVQSFVVGDSGLEYLTSNFYDSQGNEHEEYSQPSLHNQSLNFSLDDKSTSTRYYRIRVNSISVPTTQSVETRPGGGQYPEGTGYSNRWYLSFDIGLNKISYTNDTQFSYPNNKIGWIAYANE